MQDLVTALGNGFGLFDVLGLVPEVARLFEMTPEKVAIAAIFSGAGSTILSKFTGSIGYLTMPLNFVALFVGALLSNWVSEGVRLPMMNATLQTPMILTIAGMTVTALAVMMFTKSEQY